MLNQCQFIGNLGADPEIKHTQSGDMIVNMRIAVTNRWHDKNSGERKEHTEWVPVVIFNQPLAKVAEQYLKKGSKCYVSGSYRTRKWQDQSGNDRYSTEVVLQNFDGKLVLLGDGKGKGGGEETGAAAGGAAKKQTAAGTTRSAVDDLDDEVPFAAEFR